MTLSGTVQQFLAGEVDRWALVRAIAEAERLICPATNHCGEILQASEPVRGGRWQQLYTREDRCPDALHIPVEGVSTLRSLHPEAIGLSLDRGSSEEIRFEAEDIPQLRQWGRAVHVERWLAGAQVWGLAPLMRSFRHWLVLLHPESGDPLRDDGLLVFTAPDALGAWQREHPEGVRCELTSRQLAALVRQEAHVRVNPAGPRGPLSAPAHFAEALTAD